MKALRPRYDAVVVGSGPNGLAAAITIARAGRSVLVIEGQDRVGGGMRSAELTLPGYSHDLCATIFGTATISRFMRSLPLAQHGVRWIEPPAPLAHPLDNGEVVLLERSVDATASQLGRDAGRYRSLMQPLVDRWQDVYRDILGPLSVPRHPLTYARFSARALAPAAGLSGLWFRDPKARALIAGLAAHSILPLERIATAAFAVVLGLAAHAAGWPLIRGGAQVYADGMAGYLESLGGEIVCGQWISTMGDLPLARAYLFDITPRQLLAIAGHRLSPRYRRQLEGFRYGPGVFKLDLALDGPIPWRNSVCGRAGTVHVGGTMEEIAAAERAVAKGGHPERPLVLLAQPTLFDTARAPAGKHVIWAYCHVPNGSPVDMTEAIERQIERFAPGFRDRILARAARNTVQIEAYNPNYVGGDINGGMQDIFQQFTRPAARLVPYSTSDPQLFICSSSTPPGGGVHGMCGYHAARAALRDL